MINAIQVPVTPETKPMGLSREYLRQSVPSVFAENPWHGMSNRYAFVPTIEVVDMLHDQGFVPTLAYQSRSREEGRSDFTKHMLRFRHVDFFKPGNVGDEIPELVMVNSHDGTSTYEFSIGIFRLVCSNGAVVQSADIGRVNVKHFGGERFYDAIVDATAETMLAAPLVMKSINQWKGLQLTGPQQSIFAEAAREIVPNKPIEHVAGLLRSHRYGDDGADLWTISNRVQENLIRGGVQGHTPTGRRSTTRPIKAVTENLRVNRELWALTEVAADEFA